MGVFCLNKQIHVDIHRTGNSLFPSAPFIYVQSIFFIFSTIVVPQEFTITLNFTPLIASMIKVY